jgi:hypothetical protein
MIPLQCQVIAICPRRVSGSTIFRGLGRLVEIGLECAGRLHYPAKQRLDAAPVASEASSRDPRPTYNR